MKADSHYGSVYKTLKEDEWKGRKRRESTGKTSPMRSGSTSIVPKRRGPIVVEMEKEHGIYVPKKRINNEPESSRIALTPRLKKKGFWSRFKKKSKDWAYHRKEEGKETGRIAWRGTRWGYHHAESASEKAKVAAKRASHTAAELGYSLPGPFQVFTLAWQKTTKAMKLLTILVFFFFIFFIPWGIFYYTGWAVAAGIMFLISLIYWIFVNLFNGIASVIVSLINGIVRIIMTVIIFIVEAILNLLMVDGKIWVPNPLWASQYTDDPWTNEYYLAHSSGYAVQVDTHYWWHGHMLLEGSLIRYNQIADVPSLMIVTAPKWEPWMYETLIVKIFEHVPGLKGLADGMYQVNVAMASGFSDFISTADGWQIVVVGLLPIIAVIGIAAIIYYRNKHYLYG